jgi:hypothetical protein
MNTRQPLTTLQYQLLKEGLDLKKPNVKTILMRVKERTEGFDYNNPKFD